MSSRLPGVWVLARPLNGFASRDFEDGRVLYDRDSGITRLLGPLAGFVIDRLAARSRQGHSEDTLLRELMVAEEGDSGLMLQPAEFEAARGLLADALCQLATAGLVRSLS